MNYTIKITGGSAEGPFNVYYDVVDSGNILATSASRQDLLDGLDVFGVPSGTTYLFVVNLDADCQTTSSYVFPSPTPTPTATATPTLTATPTQTLTATATIPSTPTPTPTHTLTATPTLTPTLTLTPSAPQVIVYFNTAYSGFDAECSNGFGRGYSRLTGPVGTTVQLTMRLRHFISSIDPSYFKACISGETYETVLPSSNPSLGTQLLTPYAFTYVAPYLLETSANTTVTIPAAGYIDLVIMYRTNNLGGGFSDGQASLTVTAINGNAVSGDSIFASYSCTNLGDC
jgi:hypothetical protein